MNTAGPSAAHLTQEKLSDKDKEILAGLQDWVSHADFEPKSKICIDKSLGEKRPLIYGLDVMKKYVRPTYQIRRVFASEPPQIFNPEAPPNAKAPHTPHSMIAIRIIEGQPNISGLDAEQKRKSLPMEAGWTTYITEKVEVTPAVDILFITSRAALE